VLIYSDDLIVAHDKAQCSRFSCWRNLEDLYVYSLQFFSRLPLYRVWKICSKGGEGWTSGSALSFLYTRRNGPR